MSMFSPGLFFSSGEDYITLSISSNQTDYNIFTALGSPAAAVNVRVVVEEGVVVSSTSPSNAALMTGSGWAAGSNVVIVNNGIISGMGGAGGRNGYYYGSTPSYTAPQAGGDGGDAIDTQLDVTVDNTNGYIYGGGGGGGGGGGCKAGSDYYSGGSGGGGGGRANGPGGVATGCASIGSAHCFPQVTPGEDGEDTTGGQASNGILLTYFWVGLLYVLYGGNGGDGGDVGVDGTSGGTSDTQCNDYPRAGAAGGTAGKAVELNGNSITWLGGNNPTQVKGAVS